MNRRFRMALFLAFLLAVTGFSPVSANIGQSYSQGGVGAIQVNKVFPPDMASEVAVTSPLTVEFGGPVTQEFYQGLNISLFRGGQPLDGELYYNPAARQVMFKPKAPLSEGETYTAQVTFPDGSGGNSDKVWTFRATGRASSTPPAVMTAGDSQQAAAPARKLSIQKASMGAGRIMAGNALEVTFSEPIDLGSLRDAPVKLNCGKDQIGIDYRLSKDMKTLTVIPRSGLKPGTEYGIMVGNSLSGTSGARLAKNTLIPFRINIPMNPVSEEVPLNVIEEAPEEPAQTRVAGRVANSGRSGAQTLENPFDPMSGGAMPATLGMAQAAGSSGGNLKVVAMTPQNGASVTNLSQPITIAFNEEVRPETLNEFTFRVEDDFGPIPSRIKYFAGRKQAVLTPVGVLDLRRSYRVIITQGITDVHGRPLSRGMSTTFATGSPSAAPQIPDAFAASPRAPATTYRTQAARPAPKASELKRDSRELEVLDDESSMGMDSEEGMMEEAPPVSAPVSRSASGRKATRSRESLSTFKVAGILPAANSDRVPRNSKISIVFNEPANPSTVNNINISIFGHQTRVEGRVTYNSQACRAEFIPAEPLDADTQYKVLVSDKIKSAAGEPLVSRYTWEFNTSNERPRPFALRSTMEADAAFDIPLADGRAPRGNSRREAQAQPRGGTQQAPAFNFVANSHWTMKSLRSITQKGLLPNFPYSGESRVTRYEFANAVKAAIENVRAMKNNPSRPRLKLADLVELEYLVVEYRSELKSFGYDTSGFEKFLERQGVRMEEIRRRVISLNQRKN